MMTGKDALQTAFLLDASGNILACDAASADMLGYASDAIVGRAIASLLDDAQQGACQDYLSEATREACRFQVDIMRADGIRAPCQLTLVPQFKDAGAIHAYCALLTPLAGDDCESESEQIGLTPMQDMLDYLAGTFYVLNQNEQLILWNSRVELASEYSASELAGIDALSMFPLPDRERVTGKIREVFEHGREVVVEAHLLSKSGKVTPYIFSGARFTANNRFYLVGTGFDISERQAHQGLLRLRERALHACSNGIIITRCVNKDNPIDYVNPAFERITGYPAQEAIGRDARFLAAPGLDECEHKKLGSAIHERREVSVTVRNRRKNGELFWNSLTITPVLNEMNVATHFIGVLNDVTESIHRTSHLEYKLNHDPLTGLANRNLLWDRLDQALHVAQRNKTLVATLMVDLDNFKEINDTLGHDGGDELLKIVARRLQSSVRDSDTVARLGGDEFVLVLDNQPSLRYTMRMIDRLRENMAQPATVNATNVAIRMSMGVSVFPHDGQATLELMHAADVAMYHAKSAGRNDVHFYSDAMKSSNETKQKMELSLREALDNEQLFLLFQPRICLRTGKTVGVEALVRWRHPERGVLRPEAFLPDAEENGLIVPLGEWVLSNICTMLQHVRALGYADLVASMNVSCREFGQKNYVQHVAAALSKAALPVDALELEVKEEFLTSKLNLSKEIISEIRRTGIKLTIDEFGSGLSSLHNLHELPIHHIKIPRACVNSVDQKSVNGAVNGVMARTMIAIGHAMNIAVIAAGVETGAQLEFLKQNDCDQIQGNFASEPLSMPALERFLGRGEMSTCAKENSALPLQ